MVLEKVIANEADEQIISFFTERYGLWILREPPKQGFHWLAWLLPLASVLLGGALLSLFFLRKPTYRKKSSHRIRTRAEILQNLEFNLESIRKSYSRNFL